MISILNLLKSIYYDIRKQKKKALYSYKKSKIKNRFVCARLGALYIEKKQWEDAEKILSEISETSKKGIDYYRLGFSYEKLKRYVEAAKAYKNAVELRPDWNPWKEHYIYCLTKASKNSEVAKDISKYINELTSQEALMMKAELQHSVGQYWQEAETLKHAIEHGNKDTQVHMELGNAYTALKNWKKAIEQYCLCINSGKNDENIFYKVAYALEQEKDIESSNLYYELASATYKTSVDKLHDMHGREKESALYLYKTLTPSKAAKAGKRLEASFCFDKALECYELSIPEYINYCGLIAEAKNDYEKAIEYYEKAIEENKKHSGEEDWYFRLGYCYEQTGKYDIACQCYKKSYTNPDDNKKIDIQRACQEKYYFPFYHFYSNALEFCKKNEFQTACRFFKLTRPLCRHYSSSLQTFNRNRYFRLRAIYTEFCETQPLSSNVCLFESFAGRKMTCNPFGIFLEMLSREEFNGWTFVWCINDPEQIPAEFVNSSRCTFVLKDSILYTYYLATAKILINNSTFSTYFIRRNDQIYLNTWHGTPWKFMGVDIKGSFMEYANTQRNFMQATHILCPNDHTKHILIDRYSIKNIHKAEILEVGYPRVDITLRKESREKIRRQLGVTDSEKLVLYMPTFRGVMGNQIDVPEEILSAAKALQKLECKFIFSGHYFYEREFQEDAGNKILPPKNIENNELLAAADILITDFSSIAFDYLPTKKEIIYYIYDIVEYKNERGLYFGEEVFPGKKCYNLNQLITAVSESLENEYIPDETYNECISTFCPYDDGFSGKKTVDALLRYKNKLTPRSSDNKKAKLLFYGGYFSTNGITRSFLNLLSKIDKNKYDLYVVTPGKSIESDQNRIELFKQLPKEVSVIGFVGTPNLTVDEERVHYKFNKCQYLDSKKMRDIWDNSLRREYRRIFCDIPFDAVIQFDGYSPFWCGLFANSDAKKYVFLHNTMKDEMKDKYPNLENAYREFSKFDKIVSVSEALNDENKRYLSKTYDIPEEKFVFVENTQDFTRIERLSAQDPDPFFKDTIANKISFVAIGRLSIEKGHKKLINAFVKAHATNPNIVLFIVGDGPLFTNLTSQINNLKAQSYIFLTGYKSNPYPYIKNSDCFVLPSDHEGQPMVLFEAMSLKKPILATDIPSNRGVLERFVYGELVENSSKGLTNAINNFCKDTPPVSSSFNKAEYNNNCLSQFYNILNN
ncbi:MAG: CDP-glycerol glycerophosphotransferase family protein [Desulfovibrio sp.]|nr:CDP-glycerol glycerophosphotransferase family protein [Desulfovibrio sp.]